MKILITASTMVHIKNFHMPYIERLKEDGNEVYILSNGEGADFNIPFEKKTLSFKNLCLVSKIRKILKKEHFDVVYLHTTLAAFYVRLAIKGLKRRPYVVNTVHGYLFSRSDSGIKKKVYLKCEKILKKQTDDIVVMNQEDYEIATENALCLGNVYKINGMGIKNIIDVQRHKSEGFKRLTFVGEISKRKNQELLVRALAYLPNVHLTLVGDGACRSKIERLAKDIGVESRLTITGFTKDVLTYLGKADIYVSASKIEGLPFNIMEAMSAKLPIVASDIKGHRDLLPSSSLFEGDNLDELVRLINEASYEQVSYDIEKYKLENVIDDNMRVYLSFVKE